MPYPQVALKTLAAIVEAVLEGVTTLVMEENSVVVMALVAAMVMVDTMAIMDG